MIAKWRILYRDPQKNKIPHRPNFVVTRIGPVAFESARLNDHFGDDDGARD